MSIYSTAVNKPISTLMIFTAILVLGIASYLQLPVDQYPKMDPPYITVMAAYPGANASDIEACFAFVAPSIDTSMLNWLTADSV